MSCTPAGTVLSSQPTATRLLSTATNSYYLDGRYFLLAWEGGRATISETREAVSVAAAHWPTPRAHVGPSPARSRWQDLQGRSRCAGEPETQRQSPAATTAAPAQKGGTAREADDTSISIAVRWVLSILFASLPRTRLSFSGQFFSCAELERRDLSAMVNKQLLLQSERFFARSLDPRTALPLACFLICKIVMLRLGTGSGSAGALELL